MLGSCYYYGNGFMEDKKKAFELYLKSAKGGYRNALEKVGFCYEHGDGILKDTNKAFEWYLKAANKGDSYYQYLVAKHYNYEGYITKNEEKGFYEWFKYQILIINVLKLLYVENFRKYFGYL